MTTDPKPPYEPGMGNPLSTRQLETLCNELSKMMAEDLQKFYETSVHMSHLNQTMPPGVGSIQQLMAAWKELQRRQKGKT
jgi:hypothetical protein